jgi:hypothetical protein
MNLASNTASISSTVPSRVAAIQGMAECLTWCWMLETRRPVLRSYQVIEFLSGDPEVDNEVAGQVLRLTSPRFSCQRRIRAASSLRPSPLMTIGRANKCEAAMSLT